MVAGLDCMAAEMASKAGSTPTGSGKLSRAKARTLYLAGEIKP